jgi:hypothetical protein
MFSSSKKLEQITTSVSINIQHKNVSKSACVYHKANFYNPNVYKDYESERNDAIRTDIFLLRKKKFDS